MAKILFLGNHFVTLYKFRKELISRLRQEGHDIYISLPKSEKNRILEEMGCHIIPTEMDRRGMNPLKDWKLFLQYRRIIRELQPDFMFSYTIKPNIYGALANRHTKCRQICNITGTGTVFSENKPLGMLARLLYRLSIKHAYQVFFQNTGDRDYFIRHHMIGDNYAMLPGSGCNLSEYTLQEMPNDSVVRFIFLSRIMKLKGIEEYLACAKAIKSNHPNTEFLIAGMLEEPNYLPIIEQYARDGYVTYLGFQKDTAALIAACHCTILPSHGGEGVPNSLLESAAVGRACIGTRIHGITDVIEDDKTGFLTEPHNASDLIQAVERFLKLSHAEKQQMGYLGRNKIEASFNRDVVVNAYIHELKTQFVSKKELYILKKRRIKQSILRFLSFIPDSIMLRMQYFIKCRRILHLKTPRRFSEKLQWYKLYYRDPEMIRCADKYEVQDYIRECGFASILTPCYGIYEHADAIDFDALPSSFVIKDTLGSGGNQVILVPNQANINKAHVKKLADSWCKLSHTPSDAREWVYDAGKPHRILIEEYLTSPDNLIEYKFFCFYGKISFLYVISNRKLGVGGSIHILDAAYQPIDVHRVGHEPHTPPPEKPYCFDRMCRIANRLSAPFPHVRVDLYLHRNEIRFGELTFFSAGGYMNYHPDRFDLMIGEVFALPSSIPQTQKSHTKQKGGAHADSYRI